MVKMEEFISNFVTVLIQLSTGQFLFDKIRKYLQRGGTSVSNFSIEILFLLRYFSSTVIFRKTNQSEKISFWKIFSNSFLSDFRNYLSQTSLTVVTWIWSVQSLDSFEPLVFVSDFLVKIVLIRLITPIFFVNFYTVLLY